MNTYTMQHDSDGVVRCQNTSGRCLFCKAFLHDLIRSDMWLHCRNCGAMARVSLDDMVHVMWSEGWQQLSDDKLLRHCPHCASTIIDNMKPGRTPCTGPQCSAVMIRNQRGIVRWTGARSGGKIRLKIEAGKGRC